MAMPQPDVRTQIIPYIFYRDVAATLEWLAKAFGFVETMRVDTPNGGKHGEMTLDGQTIMMGQGSGEWRMQSAREAATSTQGVFLWIADADGHFGTAQAAGAEVIHPPQDLSYGRGYALRDLEGHPWFFTTPWAE